MTHPSSKVRGNSARQRTLRRKPRKLDHRFPTRVSCVHRWPEAAEAYLCQGLVTRHKVFVRGDLGEKTLGDDVVVGCVAGVIPVVDHLIEHCTRLPPIVGLWQQAHRLACKVAFVVGHHAVGDGGSGTFDGFCSSSDDQQFFLRGRASRDKARHTSARKIQLDGRRHLGAGKRGGQERKAWRS